uniref:Secreted protein n=1 Tax=Saimiri boliviensis boliviensis TaxID=39432 RepID=A0A2K6TIR2_SAIBB
MVIMFSPCLAVTAVIGSCCQNCLSDNENHCKEEDPTRSYGDRLFQALKYPHEILFDWWLWIHLTTDYPGALKTTSAWVILTYKN